MNKSVVELIPGFSQHDGQTKTAFDFYYIDFRAIVRCQLTSGVFDKSVLGYITEFG